jgi:hydrogenase/urease accessory protein HupE
MPGILTAARRQRLLRQVLHACLRLAALLGLAPGAAAHFIGLTDSAIQLTEAGVRIVQTIPAEELAELADAPEAALDEARAWYLEALKTGWHLSADDEPCELVDGSARPLPQIDALQFDLRFRCRPTPLLLDISYPLAARFDPGHANPTRIWIGGKQMPWRFSRESALLRLPVATILERSGETLPAGFPDDDPNAGLAQEGAPPSGKAASAPAPSFTTMARLYVPSGVEHILEGPDHVAFVLALLLVPLGVRRLLIAITLFTVAHSLTLALSHFGVLSLPPAITEPLIAFSVLVMGVENLLMERHPRAQRFREATVFAFGLVHGVGLSYQLAALPSLSPLEQTVRLLMFNVGVELGQLVIVVLAWPLLNGLLPQAMRLHATRLGSAALVGLGAFWLLERLGPG